MEEERKAVGKRRFFKDSALEWKWMLYDVGNSAFTLLASVILPIYFSYLAGQSGVDETSASTIWSFAASGITLTLAVLSPILGTFSDYRGFKRPLFFLTAILGILGCFLFAVPMPYIAFLIVFVFAKIFYSVSLVFYDSMLSDVTSLEKADDISSKGYAFGYIGSCIPFLISILLIVVLPIDTAVSMPIAFAINALWWLGFTIPLALSYRQKHYVERERHALRNNFRRLFHVLGRKKDIPNRKGILLFLVAFFFYIDGVYSIIDMATSFGTALGFDSTSLILALLVTQVVAFPAAIAYGKLARKGPSDVLIFVGILAYTAIGLFAIFLTQEWQFWVLAVGVGLFQGGIQSLSRSYFAKIIPSEESGCLFGILDIFGKGASFLGTMLFGIVTHFTGDVNLGVIPIACLFVFGIVFFLLAAKENRRFDFSAKEGDGGTPTD